MDAGNLYRLAMRTSESLAEAMQFNQDIHDALQSQTLQHQKSQADFPPGRLRSQLHSQLRRHTVSDLESMESSGPPLDSANWLHRRPEPKAQMRSQEKATKEKLKCPAALQTGGDSGNRDQSLQAQNQSVWEKAQTRFLTAMDANGGSGGVGGARHAKRKPLRRSQSVTAGLESLAVGKGNRHRQKQKRHKHQQQQQLQQQQKQEHSKAPKKKRHSTITALTSSMTLSQMPTLQLKPKPKAKSQSSSAQDEVSPSPGQREAACLCSAEGLLQACRQAIRHPLLTPAYADTLGHLAADLLQRLEPYSTAAGRPFPMSNGQLEQTRAAVQEVRDAAAGAGTGLLSQQLLSRAAESLEWLRPRLQFHLKPDSALPAMEPALRLRYFSEYCCLMLEDCSDLRAGRDAPEAAAHTTVLLSVMRYFVGNLRLLGDSGADREALLMRCYECLEWLQLGGGAEAAERRLREQQGSAWGREFFADLSALCDLVISESQRRTDCDIVAAAATATASSPRSNDFGSEGRSTFGRVSAELQSAAIADVCAAADCVIRRLKRLIFAESPAAADDGARLGRGAARLLLACERSGLRVRTAFLDKLGRLRRAWETAMTGRDGVDGGGGGLHALSFEFFYSLLTDSLLFRRGLDRRLQLGGHAVSDAASNPQNPSVINQEVSSLLSLISSVVCDLYMAASTGQRDSLTTSGFQTDLSRMIDLVNLHGLAFLSSAKKRQLRQCLLKLMAYMTSGAQMQSTETLMRLLLEVRLHLDRENLTSSAQLWVVEKTVPFSALPRYLAMRGARVVQFTAWSQASQQLRQLLSPTGRDPAVLRVERQCRCRVALAPSPSQQHHQSEDGGSSDGKASTSRSRARQLLTVDLRGGDCHVSHAACIRLLTDALSAERLPLEPCEATVQVTANMQQ